MELRRIAPALGIVLLVLSAGLAGCSDDDDAPAAATSSTRAGSSQPPGFVDPDDIAPSTVVSETTVGPVRPEGAVVENALEILGDTLGIGEACAGRNDAGDVEYRYVLSNDGQLVLTLDEGQVVRAVYEGRSGRFEGSQIDDISVDDGFVTGSTPVSDGTTDSELRYRATIPIRNCDTPTASTVVSSDDQALGLRGR